MNMYSLGSLCACAPQDELSIYSTVQYLLFSTIQLTSL